MTPGGRYRNADERRRRERGVPERPKFAETDASRVAVGATSRSPRTNSVIPAATRHVPMLDELDRRLEEQLDPNEWQECRSRSAGLDLFDAATDARSQRDQRAHLVGHLSTSGEGEGLPR
jgi:hypothetical protein